MTKGKIHVPGITQMMMVKVYECDACTDTDVDDYGDPGFPDNNCMKSLPMEDCNEDDSFIDGNSLNLLKNLVGSGLRGHPLPTERLVPAR